ncbi:tripartite tricarboxylate transporter permease [Alicyclobacillus fastidiosus]|uniref:Tripartite tricarboxylate transporter permease n=1 Tax=Alicyclobacillus fastidiosus TaxID=392011 RepID=A0ABV5AIJ3_9BACL|nr:tripartite tricarboxylate transporter permease [Alicyclobacillus fastidiosus]WEH07837.1 tripartite tricarboxylate transporter permease [Alicyclobacillus fastidiosus]
MLHQMILGFDSLFTLDGMLMILFGSVLGTFVGAIPGLGGAVLMTMLLPFIYGMPVIPALCLLLAAHSGIYFSGSVTAILLNTPGAPESAATTFDGYAMTRRGQAKRALGISALSTTVGGWIGVGLLLIVIPFMFQLIKLFQPSEYLVLAILAIVLIGQMRSGSMTKGLLSGLFGLMMSFVGYDPITGVQRFTFHQLALYNGFNITAVALGIFAFAEMFHLYSLKRARTDAANVNLLGRTPGSGVLDGIKDVLAHPWLMIRSAILGTLLGVVPGIGGVAANFISYGQAMKTSKHPEKFGTGIPEGIIAPESSSISKEAGNLVPTVALGVPGGVGMAVLMSGFTILGIVPGPSMLKSNLDAVFAMAFVIAIGSLLSSAMGLAIVPLLARISRVRSAILVPFIFALAALGSYAADQSMGQVIAVFGFGIVGLLMKRFNYSVPAAMIGFILGSVAEQNLYLTQQLFGLSMFKRPLTDFMILVILFVVLNPYLKRFRRTPVGAKGEMSA